MSNRSSSRLSMASTTETFHTAAESPLSTLIADLGTLRFPDVVDYLPWSRPVSMSSSHTFGPGTATPDASPAQTETPLASLPSSHSSSPKKFRHSRVPVPRLDDDFAIPNVCETTPTTHAPAYREWFVVQIDFTRADLEINWDAFAPLRDNTLGLELDWPTWTAPEIERPDSALSIGSDQAVHNRFGLVMVGKELPTIPEESEY